MTRPRPDVEVGGYTVTARLGRVYLVDQQPDSDPGMTAEQARALAAALTAAAGKADRLARRKVQP
ncbi:MAG TPA: hypothetical protein VGQ26_14090 [Streptosporangiaceae bacterium]|nr:hypothetical protein [Streptosporangiaceae bacterium]